MLPSIIDIADQHQLECNPRTRNKKQTLYKCPFCLGDANRRGKYKLSLNAELNVFKCWLCGECGGVIDFESKLLGVPYEEVKKKYLKKRKYHKAEMLSPKQLSKIDWAKVKRQNYEQYKQSLDEVLLEWMQHEYTQKVLAYGKLIIAVNNGYDEKTLETLLVSIMEQGEQEGIPNVFSLVWDEYFYNDGKKPWAIEAIQLARMAWDVQRKEGDGKAMEYFLLSYHLQFKKKIEKRKEISKKNLCQLGKAN